MSRLPMRRPKYLGDKIRNIRENRVDGYLTQDDFADLLRATLKSEFNDSYPELNREYVSGFERGTRVVPPIILLAYAHLANVYVDVIIDDRLVFSSSPTVSFPLEKKTGGVFKK